MNGNYFFKDEFDTKRLTKHDSVYLLNESNLDLKHLFVLCRSCGKRLYFGDHHYEFRDYSGFFCDDCDLTYRHGVDSVYEGHICLYDLNNNCIEPSKGFENAEAVLYTDQFGEPRQVKIYVNSVEDFGDFYELKLVDKEEE